MRMQRKALILVFTPLVVKRERARPMARAVQMPMMMTRMVFAIALKSLVAGIAQRAISMQQRLMQVIVFFPTEFARRVQARRMVQELWSIMTLMTMAFVTTMRL